MFSALWNAVTGRDSASSSGSTTPTRDGHRGYTAAPRDWYDAGFSEDAGGGGYVPLPPDWSGSGTGNSKLFYQLLDDLDGLSNGESAHRRRKAREIMSDFIFHPASSSSRGEFSRDSQFRRSSAAEYGRRRPQSAAVTREEKAARRASGDFSALNLRVPSPKVSPEHRAARCRSGDFSAVDVLCSPRVSPQHLPNQPQQQQQRLRGHLDRLQWLSHPPFGSTKEVNSSP